MFRNALIAAVLGLCLSSGVGGVALAGLQGPGPWFGSTWVWGNDTGGIIPYTPGLKGGYREMAANYCARWGRLSYVTSVHPKYGDYIAFVCIERPGMVH